MTADSDLYIRADATPQMGAGHIMRTLALAQAWPGKVTFLSHTLPDWLTDKLEAESFAYHPIPIPYPHPSDIHEVTAVLSNGTNPWLVLDGYHLDNTYQNHLHEAGHKALLMDDGLFRQQHNANIVVNQNLNAEYLDYQRHTQTTYLLGASYTLLRNEFLSYNQQEARPNDASTKLLVTMGGSDPTNQTHKVLRAITNVQNTTLKTTVVVGGSNAQQDQLMKTAETHPNVEIIQNANMAQQIATADLAITAGGSTCWELAYMGVPSLVLIVAKNQRNIARALDKNNIAHNLGWSEKVTVDEITHALCQLLQDKTKREQMKQSGQSTVDGKGRQRIINAMRAWPCA